MSADTRKRACAVCVHEGKVLLVHLRDPLNHKVYPVPPGGMIEPGESAAQAAVRETLEETGYRVSINKNRQQSLQYHFHWNGKVYDCDTKFFLAHLADDQPTAPSDPSHVIRVTWEKINDLKEILGFHPEIRDAVLRLVS